MNSCPPQIHLGSQKSQSQAIKKTLLGKPAFPQSWVKPLPWKSHLVAQSVQRLPTAAAARTVNGEEAQSGFLMPLLLKIKTQISESRLKSGWHAPPQLALT